MPFTADGVLQAAATMVQAVMGGGPSGITIPTTGSTFDAVTTQRNLYAEEILKEWVTLFKNILGDPTDWPFPAGATAGGGGDVLIPALKAAIVSVGTTNPTLTAAMQAVLALLPGAKTSPAPVTAGS